MDNIEQLLFQIISYCGSARSFYLEALNSTKKKDYEEAKKMYANGDDAYELGHRAHLELLSKFKVDDRMLLVIHAEDQLMSAENFKIVCKELMELHGLNIDENS